MESSRSSTGSSDNSKRSITEVRQVLGEHLRAQQDKIEQELLASIGVFEQDHRVEPEYAVGLRDSVSIALEYGIQGIESGEIGAPPVPTSLYGQARLAARNGVKLETVINRYVAGFALLQRLVNEIADEEEINGSAALREVRRVGSIPFERLITIVSEQHADETRKLAASSDLSRLTAIRDLLNGKQSNTSQFNYHFKGFHVGLITQGPHARSAVDGLAKALDCIALSVVPSEGTTWAWLGRRKPIEIGQIRELVDEHWPSRVAIAIGELGQDLSGWRLTHWQAKSGLPVSERRGGAFFQFGDDPMLVAILRDPLLAESFRRTYLDPLLHVGDSEKYIQTLHAYFNANRNGQSAAAQLGVKRQTVAHRLKQVEKALGCSIADRATELETSLRLYELQRSQHSSEGI